MPESHTDWISSCVATLFSHLVTAKPRERVSYTVGLQMLVWESVLLEPKLGGRTCVLIIRIGQLVTTLYKLVPGNIYSSNYIPICLNVTPIPFSVNRTMILSLNVIKTFSALLTFACLGSTACILTVDPQLAGGRDPRTRAPLSLSPALIQSFVHLSLCSRTNGIISVPCRPLRTLLKLTKLVSNVFISSLYDQEIF